MFKTIGEKLRDPIWQSVGVFIALISVMLPFILGSVNSENSGSGEESESESKLIVTQISGRDLIDFPDGIRDRTRLLIDGREAKSVKFHRFMIINQNSNPILPSDFIEPLVVSVSEKRQIITIQSNKADEFSHGGSYEHYLARQSIESFVESDWSELNSNTYKLKPLLLNPGDGLEITIYTSPISDTVDTVDFEQIDFQWTCRIINVKCPSSLDLPTPPEPQTQNPLLAVQIYHTGWAIYGFIGLMVVFFVSTILLAGQSKRIQNIDYFSLFIVVINLLLAASTAEIVTDWYFNGRNIRDQATISSSLLFIHLIWTLYLFLPTSKNILQNFLASDSAPNHEVDPEPANDRPIQSHNPEVEDGNENKT